MDFSCFERNFRRKRCGLGPNAGRIESIRLVGRIIIISRRAFLYPITSSGTGGLEAYAILSCLSAVNASLRLLIIIRPTSRIDSGRTALGPSPHHFRQKRRSKHVKFNFSIKIFSIRPFHPTRNLRPEFDFVQNSIRLEMISSGIPSDHPTRNYQ